jgi:hypothetical protein
MPADETGHPQCADPIESEAQSDTGPANRTTDENIENSIIECCGEPGKSDRCNDKNDS